MPPSITYRLVLSLLGLVFILVAELSLTKCAMDRGFMTYINQQHHEKMEHIAEDLKSRYTTADSSWRSLTQHEFSLILVKYADAPNMPLAPRPGPPYRLGPPVSLYDANNRLIAGTTIAPSEDLISVPIVLNGKTIGQLNSVKIPAPISPGETAFVQQQFTTIVTIGIGSVFLALVISLFLSRSLLKPIGQIERRVAQLSGGDYSDSEEAVRKDELGQLLENINHLGKKLASNKASRSEWLANISHELRTPLTAILGEIEALRDGIRTFDSNNLAILEKESQRLKDLVEDLYELSISDIGGLSYKFETLDLAECLNSALDTLDSRAEDRGIRIRMDRDGDATIEGDPKRIDRLFQNLLENSLAYTQSPGDIKISVSNDSDWVIVAIEDSSPGVSLDHYSRIFEPLYRADESRNWRTGGAGLGLAICRNIVEAHRGLISAMPSLLGGICIQLRFPMKHKFSK